VQILVSTCKVPKDSANDGRHLSCSLTNRCDLHSLAAELSITCPGFEAHPYTLSLSEQNLHTPTQNGVYISTDILDSRSLSIAGGASSSVSAVDRGLREVASTGLFSDLCGTTAILGCVRLHHLVVVVPQRCTS
ncbi:Clathrin heavy chain, partial [Giardia duodenalis]